MNNPSKVNVSNPFVFTHKTPLMQRLADLVRSGHTQYVMGTIPIEKAGFLAYKFETQFRTNIGKVEACRARQRGESSSRLLFLHQADNDHLTWVLLFQPGVTPDHSGQKWRDALTDKIILTNYELVRHTRAGSGKPAWTWRYTQKQYDLLRDAIISVVRSKQDESLRQVMHSIARSLGFAGIREQVKKLNALIRAEWKRRRAKSEAMPEPAYHGYTRRFADRGCRLSELRLSAGQKNMVSSGAKGAVSLSRGVMPHVGNGTVTG